MKTATITIAGEKHLLCFSLRVIQQCTERYGGIDKIGAALDGKDSLDEAIWLLAVMMKAGAAYADRNAIDNPPPLSADDMLDFCDIGDLADLKGAIVATITNGSTAEVEADPPKGAGKNAPATPEA